MPAAAPASPAAIRRAIPDAATETKWLAPDGYAVRRIDWPEPAGGADGRGSILFMPGRGDAYEKYLETFEHWRQRGWRVSAADWRGQAGSGRLGTDATTGHVDDFGIWIEDVAALWRDWSAGRKGPLVACGHSMGGHLMLRAVAEKALDPAPDALILSTPMLGMRPEFLPLPVARAMAWFMQRIGAPTRPAWKWSERPGEFPAGRQDLLTHDDARYSDEAFWRTERPELVMGPGSWGWVAASLASTAQLNRAGVMEGIDIPVFVLTTSADKLVSHKANLRAAQRLPRSELCVFGEEAAHEILREADPVRDRALVAIDAFLDQIAAA